MNKRGYFEQSSINELYPNAIMVQPMGIWQIPNAKKHLTEDILKEKHNKYFAEEKKDGNWYAMSITNDDVYLFARTISKKTGLLVEKSDNVPHLKEAFSKLPAGTYIEGEIYYPNGNSDLVRTIMGCNSDKAIKRQKCLDAKYNEEYNLKKGDDNFIHYYIHNILFYNGEDLTNKTNLERWNILEEIYNSYFKDNQYIELANIYMPSEYYDFFALASEKIEKGEEGLVLKLIDGVYYPDQKKAWETIKIKREDNVDVICLGFEEPTKLYEGECIDNWNFWLNEKTNSMAKGVFYGVEGYIPITKNYYHNWSSAIKIGVYDEKTGNLIDLGTVSSGLTEELKQKIKEKPEDYLMKPVALECMEIYHGTSLRSPRLIKFRDDINIKDCTLQKLQ